jgi:hypothetical protein
MRHALIAVLLAGAVIGCTSPEATRTRGGGPGADVGNTGNPVEMHAGSHPYHATPNVLPAPRGGAASSTSR